MSATRNIGTAERNRSRPDAYKATDTFYRSISIPTRAENDRLARTDRNELARRNIPLVLYTVSNLLFISPTRKRKSFNVGGPRIGFAKNDRGKADDFVQDGILGLIRASETYDPDRGVTFATYAIPWIIQTISHGDSRQNTVHLPVEVGRAIRIEPETLSPAQRESAYHVIRGFIDIDKPLGGSAGDLPEVMENITLGGALPEPERDLGDDMIAATALRQLDDLERKVIEHRYGIVGAPLDLQATGTKLGLTRREVREIERRAMKKMQAMA